jgi:hypothetical protein
MMELCLIRLIQKIAHPKSKPYLIRQMCDCLLPLNRGSPRRKKRVSQYEASDDESVLEFENIEN